MGTLNSGAGPSPTAPHSHSATVLQAGQGQGRGRRGQKAGQGIVRQAGVYRTQHSCLCHSCSLVSLAHPWGGRGAGGGTTPQPPISHPPYLS